MTTEKWRSARTKARDTRLLDANRSKTRLAWLRRSACVRESELLRVFVVEYGTRKRNSPRVPERERTVTSRSDICRRSKGARSVVNWNRPRKVRNQRTVLGARARYSVRFDRCESTVICKSSRTIFSSFLLSLVYIPSH